MGTTQPIRDSESLQKFKGYYFEQKPNPRNYTLCILGLNTALRITDILHLKWGMVYDFAKEKCVSHITVMEQKTGKTNTIALNPATTDALCLYLSGYESSPNADDYLFKSRKGPDQALCRSQAFRIIKEAAAWAGMEQHVSCHSLRKTFGYHAWQQGIPPALLMEIYNHSSYQITKRYLGIDQDDKDNVFLNISL